MPTPEELARLNIDKLLNACGWVMQDTYGHKRVKLTKGIENKQALMGK